MRDVLVLTIVIGFFAVASLYVRGCTALIGTAADVVGDGGIADAEPSEVVS